MKILFITSVFPEDGYGIADYSFNLVKNLAKKEGALFDISLLTTNRRNIIESCDFCSIYKVMDKWGLREFAKVKELIKEIKPDIIHMLVVPDALYSSVEDPR